MRCATVWSRCGGALRETGRGGKPQAHQKYWQALLGQAGGGVRRPMLNLTEPQRRATRDAFERAWSACLAAATGQDVRSGPLFAPSSGTIRRHCDTTHATRTRKDNSAMPLPRPFNF